MPSLDILNFDLRKPSKQLESFIQAIWFVKHPFLAQEAIFKVLSDGRMGIAFNFGDELVTESRGKSYPFPRGCQISGPRRHLSKMKFKGKLDVVGIRFQAGAGHHFMSCPIRDLTDQSILADEQNHPEFFHLYQQLRALHDKNAIQKKIEDFFAHFIENRKIKENLVLNDIICTIHDHPEWNVKTLSAHVKLSTRDLQRLFKNHIGIPPGAYIRLKRTSAIKEQLASGDFLTFADLSLEKGYYDQAHFIKDFKSFMEETPKGYYNLKQNQD